MRWEQSWREVGVDKFPWILYVGPPEGSTKKQILTLMQQTTIRGKAKRRPEGGAQREKSGLPFASAPSSEGRIFALSTQSFSAFIWIYKGTSVRVGGPAWRVFCSQQLRFLRKQGWFSSQAGGFFSKSCVGVGSRQRRKERGRERKQGHKKSQSSEGGEAGQGRAGQKRLLGIFLSWLSQHSFLVLQSLIYSED